MVYRWGGRCAPPEGVPATWRSAAAPRRRRPATAAASPSSTASLGSARRRRPFPPPPASPQALYRTTENPTKRAKKKKRSRTKICENRPPTGGRGARDRHLFLRPTTIALILSITEKVIGFVKEKKILIIIANRDVFDAHDRTRKKDLKKKQKKNGGPRQTLSLSLSL